MRVATSGGARWSTSNVVDKQPSHGVAGSATPGHMGSLRSHPSPPHGWSVGMLESTVPL